MSDVAKAFADLRAGKLKMQCAVCGVDQGGCDCWTKCKSHGCTWSYRKGEFCPNCKRHLSALPPAKPCVPGERDKMIQSTSEQTKTGLRSPEHRTRVEALLTDDH